VPGNTKPARVYLSMDNYGILDRQLTETYGETIEELRGARVERIRQRLVLRKTDVPPLRLTQRRRHVVRSDAAIGPLALERPTVAGAKIRRHTFTMAEYRTTRRVLRELGETVEVVAPPNTVDVATAAVDLAATYRLDVWQVADEVRRLYPEGEVPAMHLAALAEQIEEQTRAYEHVEEEVDVALALVKLEGYRAEPTADGGTDYVAEIVCPKGKEHLLVPMQRLAARDTNDLSFHYDPYNFDSRPEEVFFEEVLSWANLRADEVEDILFTGAVTDPAKTDFAVEYKDADGKWRRYTPDFVIRRKDGRVMVVEIKGENMRDDPVNGLGGRKAMALQALAELNPGDLAYEIVFAKDERSITADAWKRVREFIGVDGDGDGLRIPVDRARVEEFCRKWKIQELAFFGSVLRDDFDPDSDVDVLYTFADDAHWGLFDIVRAERELEKILGRPVDLVDRTVIEASDNWIRRTSILEGAKTYVPAG